LANAVEEAEADFLKLWIHSKGPEKILACAAEKNQDIEWENMYGHQCQACLRLYKDPAVREVVREHHVEVIAEVLESVWLDQDYVPNRLATKVRGPQTCSSSTKLKQTMPNRHSATDSHSSLGRVESGVSRIETTYSSPPTL
jgi:hypothetical protein